MTYTKIRGTSLSVTKQICDAEGCFAAAEEEIKVPVGQMGEISLAVCRKCKPRFIHIDE